MKPFKYKNNLHIFSILIVSLGIIFRFYHQFINWAFNEDEINLGLDILDHDYLELLKPFDSFQSAPPLFLILQKLFSTLGPSYVSLKILSFLSSSVALIYFKKLIEKRRISIITISLLLIFTFHPFILYHSLTLKQYTFDLTFGLIAVYYFEKKRSFLVTFGFFTIWCLLSNAALFFTTAFIINILLKDLRCISSKGRMKENIQKNIKEAVPYILAPLTYIGFFIWFMNQPGADEAKNFMVNYWQFWFVPLDGEIFWWYGVQLYRMMFFFYSTYLFLGLIMLSGFLFGCYFMWSKKDRIDLFFVKIYSITIGIHLILSTLQVYPFSDRLYLYMGPLVLYVAVYGLVFLLTSLNLKKIYIESFIFIFSSLILVFNISYMNYKENDVMTLSDKLRFFNNKKIFRTSRADPFITKWVKFTNHPNSSKELIYSENCTKLDSIQKLDLVISRRYKNFGHKLRPVKIEDSLKSLLAKRKNRKVISVDGYDVYLILE